MDDRVMDSEIELRELNLHQRKQSALKRNYELQTTRKAVKRQRIAHLRVIADHLGKTRAALEASPRLSRSYPC